MTAPAAAVSSAIVAPALRAPPQPATDRFTFAAMLDSLPGAAAKAGSSAAEEGSQTSSDARQGQSPSREPNGNAVLSDGAFLSSLSFALPSATAPSETPGTTAGASSLASASTKAAGLDTRASSNGSTAAAVTTGTARLIDARAFHFAPSTSSIVSADLAPAAGPPSTDAPSFTPAPTVVGSANSAQEQSPLAAASMQGRGLTRDATPVSVSLSPAEGRPVTGAASAMSKAPAPTAPTGTSASPNPSASPARADAQASARGVRKSEAAPAHSAARVASSVAPPAKPAPGDKTADGRPPDPIPSAGQPAVQGSALGPQLSATGPGVPSFGSSDSSARTADVAPRASAPAASQASTAPPVKEIDVDLSPSGLEDVSMTMRLAGDRLSVVIRAASSQTTGSIEGARDAIADRLAAIGQPLESLIVRQTGVNADANANGNAASGEEGSTGGGRQSGQGAGEQGGDASSSRRGAARDRSF